MNNKIKSEEYRKLSISALVTGILAISLAILLFFSPKIDSLVKLLNVSPDIFIPLVLPIFYLISIFRKSIALITPVVIGLSIAAVVCGSIDLKRIKSGRYSNKGRGFDIAGIVLGGIFILFILVFLLLEVFIFH